MGAGKWSYALPEHVDLVRERWKPVNRFERELEQLSLEAQREELWQGLGPLPVGYYRKQLEEAGLLDTGKAVSAVAARSWVGAFMKRSRSCQGLLNEDSSLSWVELLLRDRPGTPFPPMKHLVVLAAIKCSAGLNSPTLSHRPTGMKQLDRSLEDQEAAGQLAACLEHAKRDSIPVQINQLLKSIGLWGAYRHSRSRFPEVSKVIEINRTFLEDCRCHFSRIAKRNTSGQSLQVRTGL